MQCAIRNKCLEGKSEGDVVDGVFPFVGFRIQAFDDNVADVAPVGDELGIVDRVLPGDPTDYQIITIDEAFFA